jgi:hypothetical protein
MIVVLDTNLWLKELALNSGMGSVFRFFLKHQKARLAVPEVVRLEVQHNLRALIQGAIDDVDKGNRQLLALFGSIKEIVLPTAQEVDTLVTGVFSGLRVEKLDIPLSLESARASFLKTVEKVPPSDKTQEFKDGVLWSDCLRLLDTDEVLLATQDKAFYADREYARGLAKNLHQETEAKPNRLRITHSIAEVLDQVRTPISIDDAWFVSIVQERAHGAAKGLISRAGAAVAGNAIVKRELFATENPDVLYFKYVITVPCADISGGGRTDVYLVLAGDGSLKPETREIVDIRTGEETLVFTNADGTADRLRNIYMTGSAVLGHRTITHSVRHRLPDSNE